MITKTLIVSLCFLSAYTLPGNGVKPTQKMPNIPYFESQLITMTAQSLGLKTFQNSTGSYKLQVALDQPVYDVIDHNIITTGFTSDANGHLAYSIKSTLINKQSAASIELKVFNESSITKLTFNLIILSTPLFLKYPYISLFEIQVSSSDQSGFLIPYDIDNCNIYTFVKSVNISVASQLSDTTTVQSMGFRTYGSIKQVNSKEKMFEIRFQKDNKQLGHHISVTYAVLSVNKILYKQTAQFSRLELSVTSFSTSANSVYLIPQDFSQLYKSNTIFGVSEWSGLITHKPSIEFGLEGGIGVKFSSNFINNEFKYSIIQLKDYKCPSTNPYKYKGNPLCYACPENYKFKENENFSQYLSKVLNLENCKKIDTSKSGYKFNQEGKLQSVCGYCKESKGLIVEDIDQKNEDRQVEISQNTMKNKFIQTLQSLYNYLTKTAKENFQLLN